MGEGRYAAFTLLGRFWLCGRGAAKAVFLAREPAVGLNALSVLELGETSIHHPSAQALRLVAAREAFVDGNRDAVDTQFLSIQRVVGLGVIGLLVS